jgi:fimbrial chaperone protein
MRIALPLVAALAVALVPARARATDILVSPVLVELGTKMRNAILKVRNPSQEKVRYQVRAFSWTQDQKGEMQLLPTSDVVVYPPLLEIAPGDERNVRVAAHVAPGERERSYRVFVEEMPRPESPEQSGQVRVLMRIGIPVFVEPPKAERRGTVAFTAAGSGRASLNVRNEGNVRLRPTEVRLVGRSAAGDVTFEKRLDPWYVLAGDERFYEADVPEDVCAATRTLRAIVAEAGGNLEATVALPDGACAK